ncbi:MAG TPA: glycosyltransferase, partial [Acidimicrobiales bacterium]|nr:glycosyltransferase [Acidimicrobiales bacterium]
MSESDADSIAWPLVLAVVVTHNGRRWLPGCLKSLAMQTYPALEVVVVDAASEDTEAVRKLIGRLLPTASMLRLERNVGFGGAANRALELSPDARSAEFYLFLHDDVALDRDCVGLLVAAALETGAGVVGGKGLSWDEPEVL